jgi:ferrous iron transport protein B
MGGIILFASIVVWAFNYFPLNREERPADDTVMVDDSAIDLEYDSYLEMAGKVINPIMKPLGFHWRASVAALAGVPAKEIVVSTLGVLYTNNDDVSDRRLGARLAAPSAATGKPDFTGASALSFMVFILLYCPCVATVTAIARETGSWKYSLFSISYNTVVAWIAAFVTYQIAMLF